MQNAVMRHMGIGCAIALTTLAGCTDRMTDYPQLLPTDQLLAEPALPAHAADAADDLDGAGAALSSRAAGLSARAGQGNGGDADLAARAQALRQRAKVLRQTSLDDCPPDAPDCAAPQ